MRLVLLGDSHLARVRRDLDRLACGEAVHTGILNAAIGGSDAHDVLAQAVTAGVDNNDRVAVSIGTNDAAPWKQVPLADGVRRVQEFLAEFRPERLIYLASPGVDEARLDREHDRTNEAMAGYSAAYSAAFTAAGATTLDTRALLAPLGSAAFVDDGVHLSGRAYALLLPALRDALCH